MQHNYKFLKRILFTIAAFLAVTGFAVENGSLVVGAEKAEAKQSKKGKTKGATKGKT
ncbi:MAG: hypothetical protein HOI80_02390, partial [Alphaproteobacteria bacterium]|nr:hypothetical protein [Alphaproteobacteria bacterium]